MAESRALLIFAILTSFHGSCHSAKILINLTPQVHFTATSLCGPAVPIAATCIELLVECA